MTVTIRRGRFVKGTHWRPWRPHWEKSWLEHEYLTLERSAADIATSIGCRESNIDYWLAKHQIPRRSISEVRAKKYWGVTGQSNPMFGKTGPASPSYVDGSSPERQRLYVQRKGKEFLKAVYARDGFRCVRCQDAKRGPRSIHAHHIKPWAGNTELRFDQSNVVTLCRSCHAWVHSRQNAAREYLG